MKLLCSDSCEHTSPFLPKERLASNLSLVYYPYRETMQIIINNRKLLFSSTNEVWDPMNNRYTARLIKRKNQENKENDMQF